MEIEALMLARVQFALALGYHIIFPTFSIGLAAYMAGLRLLEYFTGERQYRKAFDYWLKYFALSFGMGVVSGVVLSYAIGTTFGRFTEVAGAVVGPLMSYEVMTAFFLEAGFLGIMLFGRERVSPLVHLLSTLLVAAGTLLSAFWILSANSWMHTPVGYEIIDGIIHAKDWFAIVFNPSFPYRLAHMVLAAMLSTTFVGAAIGAWYLHHDKHRDFGIQTLRNAVIAASILAPLQIFVGDLHGLNTLEHQPIKVAAMEGHWETGGNVPLLLFALPDQAAEKNHFEIGIPNITSLILTHSLDGEVQGLKSVPPEDRPPVAPVFFSFRVMVGLGLLMLLLAWYGLLLQMRGKLAAAGRYHAVMRFTAPIGFIAMLAGWITTEIGRQPWTVYGLLRTPDAVSQVSADKLITTLILFAVVYTGLFVAFIKVCRMLLHKGPHPDAVKSGIVHDVESAQEPAS